MAWPWQALVATSAIVGAPVLANPVPDVYARAMNERPARWLAHPTREDERGLIQDFAWYGVCACLLEPGTIRLLDRNFDRFAPVLVAAQRPPNPIQTDLQCWYRARAKGPQRESMKRALREWLVADVHEAPRDGGAIYGPEVADEKVLETRLAAAEALGDWGDREALPLMRRLLERLPVWSDHHQPRTVIQAAVRRINAAERPPRAADSRVVTWNPLSSWTRAGEADEIHEMPRFVSESVTLRITPGELEVEGLYDFEDASPCGTTEIAYPIAAGDGLGSPHVESVRVRDATRRAPISASHEELDGMCRISIDPDGARDFQLEIRYRQPLSRPTARYLITTARAWGRPLRRAMFEVVTPIRGLRSNLPLREVPGDDGSRRYRFDAAPFEPDRDLVVSW